MVTIADTMIGRARFEPGWRWSNDVKPIGPGDGYVIQPGHDAWIVGDEPWVTVDFSQAMADYAKPGGAA
jgi:hypothetical protein